MRGDLIAAITAGPARNLVQPVVAGIERAMPRLPPLDAVQGCAVTRQAALHPATLAAFRAACEQGQDFADTTRAAAEQAMEALPPPLGPTRQRAAVVALDSYPVGPVDVTRIQRVADVMREFLGFPCFSVRSMTPARGRRRGEQQPAQERIRCLTSN